MLLLLLLAMVLLLLPLPVNGGRREEEERLGQRTDKNACFRVFRVDWGTRTLICFAIITFILSPLFDILFLGPFLSRALSVQSAE